MRTKSKCWIMVNKDKEYNAIRVEEELEKEFKRIIFSKKGTMY